MKMNAIVVNGKGGIDTLSLEEYQKPKLREWDVLVELKAAAINPIDVKERERAVARDVEKKIVGWDGSGIIVELGKEVKNFSVGDEIMFAGDFSRDGSYAEYTAVDSRICAKKPKTMDHANAAALPLVMLTGYELLFENLNLPTNGIDGKDLVVLIINGAGGVGSATIQLAKQVLGANKVIATASRPETEEWCRNLGATDVINHYKPLSDELKRIGVDKVDICICGVELDKCYDAIIDIMRPGGKIGAVYVDDPTKIDVSKLFIPLRLTLSFELMFTRPMLDCQPEKQGKILSKVAELIDAGKIKCITNTKLNGFTLENFKKGNEIQASGKAIGKITIAF